MIGSGLEGEVSTSSSGTCEDPIESQKRELRQLVEAGLRERRPEAQRPYNFAIDKVVDEEVIHEYDDRAVFEVAYEMDFWIVRCCTCSKSEDPKFKANGVWTVPRSKEVQDELKNRKVMSDAFCPDCLTEYVKQQGLDPADYVDK
jgi:hypothetical protein